MKLATCIVPLILLLTACTPQATATHMPTATTAFTQTPEPTPSLTSEPTPIPSLTPTTKPTEPPPWEVKLNQLSPEVRDTIDHVETVKRKDGFMQLVAIAKPAEAGKEPIRRIFQWEETGEWVSYQPDVWIFAPTKDVLSELIKIPHVEPGLNASRLVDKDGKLFDLGYVGAVLMEPNFNWALLTGIIVGKIDQEGNTAWLVIDIPTANGDFVRLWHYDTNDTSTALIGIEPANQFSQTQPSMDNQEIIRVGNTWYFPTTQNIYRFILDEARIGDQVGLQLMISPDTWYTVDETRYAQTPYQHAIVDAIQGKKLPEKDVDKYMFGPSSIILSPEQIQQILD